MKKAIQIIKSRGVFSLFLLVLYKLGIMNEQRLGRLAERLKMRARLDGITVRMDTPFPEPAVKGIILLGGYEVPEQSLILTNFPKDEPIIELGGSVGVISCLVNRQLTQPTQHVVVEANPDLIPTLTLNRDTNKCQFTVLPGALAYGGPYITFYTNDGSLGGSVYRGNGVGHTVNVPAYSLAAIAQKAGFEHINLICDIEGSEIDLINHEADWLREHVGWILMEVHERISGEAKIISALALLQEQGFELVKRAEWSYCYHNTHAKTDSTMKRPIVRGA